MIKIFRPSVFPEKTHQHGWNEVLRLLRTHLHQQSGAPAFLDDFVDISFGSNISDAGIPYRHPWVGMIHHPAIIPAADPWLHVQSASAMMRGLKFKESLPQCKALITFSHSNAREIRKIVAELGAIVPVFTLAHPTEHNVPLFSWEIFEKTRQINCVGFWLRRLQTFAELRTDLTKRYIFSSHRVEERMDHLKKVTNGLKNDCMVMPYLDREDYNHALATGIGYADYIACCASNTVLEHLARHTPLIVNPLPSIVDYLGDDYPLYFESQAEAEKLTRDMGALKAGHEYLANRSKSPLTHYEWFIEAMKGILQKVL
jgi:hypothetical protein